MELYNVVGMEWGDEGKGKAANFICNSKGVDAVFRYQGGPNAGHSVKVGDKEVVLNHIPSGITEKGVDCVLSSNVVIDPIHLFNNEVKKLEENDLMNGYLFISERSPVVTKFHKDFDVNRENSDENRIGTTQTGVGPTYKSLADRSNCIKIKDLLEEDIEVLISRLERVTNHSISASKIREHLEKLIYTVSKNSNKIINTEKYILQLKADPDSVVVMEGAQGTMLDINHGCYPNVTSSNPSSGGMFAAGPINYKDVDTVVGICKCYSTRVGDGWNWLEGLESEEDRKLLDYIQDVGDEYDATHAGREWKVHWLNLPVLRYSVEVNGVDCMLINKMDILEEKIDKPVKVIDSYVMEDGSTRKVFYPGDRDQIKDYNAVEIDPNKDVFQQFFKLMRQNFPDVKIMFGDGPEQNDVVVMEKSL